MGYGNKNNSPWENRIINNSFVAAMKKFMLQLPCDLIVVAFVQSVKGIKVVCDFNNFRCKDNMIFFVFDHFLYI